MAQHFLSHFYIYAHRPQVGCERVTKVVPADDLAGDPCTQSELASAVGVGQSHISAIEKGKSEVGAELLLNIARYFGKTVEWLLLGE